MAPSDKKKKKRVLILITCGPFNPLQASKAFRMGVGLTLAKNRTTFLLIHEGVFNLLPLRGGKSPYFTINYPGIVRLITECDRVVTW